jgi:hypothetical protein
MAHATAIVCHKEARLSLGLSDCNCLIVSVVVAATLQKDQMRLDCITTFAVDWIDILECYYQNTALAIRVLGNIEKYVGMLLCHACT